MLTAAKFFLAFIASVSSRPLVALTNSHEALPTSQDFVAVKYDASKERTRPSSGSVRAVVAAAPSPTHGAECFLSSTSTAAKTTSIPAKSLSCREGERCIEDAASSTGGRCVGIEEEDLVDNSATLLPSRDLQEDCRKCDILPSHQPSSIPSVRPSVSSMPSDSPSSSSQPSASNSPSALSSIQPSTSPSVEPTSVPSSSTRPSVEVCIKCEGWRACEGADESKISCGSCIGYYACYSMNRYVEENSCIGGHACNNVYGNIGSTSCIGNNACYQVQGSVGSNSCQGESSCKSALVSIGSCQCNGDLVCKDTSNAAFSSDGICPSESPSTQPTASNSPSVSNSPSALPSHQPSQCRKCEGTDACAGVDDLSQISCGSCIGEYACYQMNHIVRSNSCIGDGACYQMTARVLSNSCIGTNACSDTQGRVKSNSCHGEMSCFLAVVSIGPCQCYGQNACLGTSDAALSSDGICPSESPSSQPTTSNAPSESHQPSSIPSIHPSSVSSELPSTLSSHKPSSSPSVQPAFVPSESVSRNPSMHPSNMPSSQPTEVVSSSPSTYPSNSPSALSSHQPSSSPSVQPTSIPNPSTHPSNMPSSQPTDVTSSSPSNKSSVYPSIPPSPSSEACLPKARRVKLQSITGVAVQVFEVQVFSSGINVARGKIARQSSNYRGKSRFSASKAIDGDVLSFSHTQSGKDCEWWELDLLEPTEVERIEIVNRWCVDETDPKQCLCRLSYTVVSLLDDDGKWVDAVLTGNTCGEKEWSHAFTPSSVYCLL